MKTLIDCIRFSTSVVALTAVFVAVSVNGEETAASDGSDIYNKRDPFWPVGWTPPPKITDTTIKGPQSPIRWADAARLLEVSALSESADGTYFAIIKGQGVVEKGDFVAVRFNGLTYRWKVIEISGTGLRTERIGVVNQK